MKLFFRIFCFLFFIFFASSAYSFSAKNVISPVKGVWNNVQPLVLNVEDESEIFYSLTDTDPLVSGFAYDGPVVINEDGNVSIKITAVSKTGVRSDVTVSYAVKKNPYRTLNEDTKKFVSDVTVNPIRKYISGTSFFIPSTFKFCINDDSLHFYQGTYLSLSSKNMWERYVPITVKEGSFTYRFVMNVVAEKKESLKQKQVPFFISDWNTITFTDEKYLYQVDNGQWLQSGTETVIDRFFSHIIRWRPVESKTSVASFSFVLPPKPQLKNKITESGTVAFYVQKSLNDYTSVPFTMSLTSSNQVAQNDSQSLYSVFEADTFKGNEVQDTMAVDVYCDGVLQGTLNTDFTLDRLPPDKPVIQTEKKDFIAQSPASVLIEAEKNADIFFAISEPIEFNIEDVDKNKILFDSVKAKNYKLYNGKNINLSSVLNKTTFYKIIAYAVDANGNISDFAEHNVVVEENNFYLYAKDYSVPFATEELYKNVSFTNVFSSLEQAINAMNKTKNICLHIFGNIKVLKPYNITSDCTIVGKNCKLDLQENVTISVTGANVQIKNCSIEKNTTLAEDKNLIVARNANLLFNDCELVGRFKKNAELIDSVSSCLQLKYSGLSVYASNYASAISARNTETVLFQTRILSSSKTCVNASVSGGKFNSYRSYFSISANDGRCLEFIKSQVELKENAFSLNKFSNKTKKMNALWRDADTIFTVEEGNIVNE